MPVMIVRDEREKLKRVSPLLITTELPTAWTREKVEYTRQDGSIGKVLLPTHTAESTEKVLYCLTEFNSTAVRTITIKTVTIYQCCIHAVLIMATIGCNHCGSLIPIQQNDA
jgi:hypothetical protein